MTTHWKAVDQYLTMVLFVFQFNPVIYCGKFINFGLPGVKGLTLTFPSFVSSDVFFLEIELENSRRAFFWAHFFTR